MIKKANSGDMMITHDVSECSLGDYLVMTVCDVNGCSLGDV